MNKKLSHLTVFSAAFLILINIIVLAGVSYNRSGDAKPAMQLTERELSLPYRSYREKENSGLAVRLNWNIVPDELYSSSYNKYALQRYGTPNWLTEDKLKTLGLYIDSTGLDANDSLFDNGHLQAEALIVVLEYNGETFQDVVSHAEKDIQILRDKVKTKPDDKDLKEQLKSDETSLTQLKTSESRLIAIDVGRNLQALRDKYADNSKYLMMRGEIRRYWENNKQSASIRQLFITNIHVPLPYSKVINQITHHESEEKPYYSWTAKPRYKVELNMGKRLEPWISQVISL